MLVPTILTAVLVTCTSFLGLLFFVFREKKIGRAMSLLTPLAAGLLLASAFLQVLPGAIPKAPFLTIVMASVLLGAIASLALSKTVWHHHHDDVCETHTFGYTNLLGEGIQNLVIGMAVASCFWISAAVGLTAALAVLVHSVPHQLGNFGFLLRGGLDKRRAMGCSLAASSTAVLGAVITYFWLLALDLGAYISSFMAGWFIFMAIEDVSQKSDPATGKKFSTEHFALLMLGIIIVEWISMLLG